MKYKHGFLALLSGCVLTVASVAHAEPGGSAGAAGSTAGTGGAGGAAAGAGGAAAGAAGTGTAGTGTGVAGAPGAAVNDIGKKCGSDADCGGGTGKCLAAKGTDLLSGGPANGYCTLDCTDWLVAYDKLLSNTAGSAGAPPAPLPYPCQPDADLNNTADNAKVKNQCLNFAEKEGDPIKAYCVQLCDFGTPEITDANAGKLDTGKCQGRNETTCYPFIDDNNTDVQTDDVVIGGWCRPWCQTDAQCGTSAYCDKGAGVCKAGARPATKSKKNGDACDTTKDECESICFRLYDADDPATTDRDESKAGICIDPCINNDTSVSCGGIAKGYCALNLFTAYDPENPTELLANGSNDIGGCIKRATDDAECDYQDAWLLRDLSGGQNVNFCVPAADCKADADCAFSCTTAADCEDGDTCKGGKCYTAGGDPNTGFFSCQPIGALGCKSYCVDHEITLPGQDACGTAGTGGAAGAANGGSGGSESSTGGKSGSTSSTGGKAGTTSNPTVGQGGQAGDTSVQPAPSSDDGGCSVPRTGGSTGSSSALLAGLGLLGALVSRRRRQG